MSSVSAPIPSTEVGATYRTGAEANSDLDYGLTNNIFDGYIVWSQYVNKDTAIPDGDFIRLNTMESEYECMSEITLHLMAGGPLQASDRPEMIEQKGWTWLYQNEELLALNKEHFIGKPLSTDISNPRSSIWFGQRKDGSYMVALFNRDDEKEMYIDFASLGIYEEMKIRDLWSHKDEGSGKEIKAIVPRHGVKVVQLTK